MLADSLSSPTVAPVVHLGTGTTIAMWLAVIALLAIAGRLGRMTQLYSGFLKFLGQKEQQAENEQVAGLLQRIKDIEGDMRTLRSALALARSLSLSGERMSKGAEEQIDAALRKSRGYED